MSLTATSYINLIRTNYPVRGQDNDSQGFRDNFSNITQALRSINSQTEYLNLYSVVSTNPNNSFNGNIISDANFQNCSEVLYDNGEIVGNIYIDYTLGSYQTIQLSPGLSNIIINWPQNEGVAAELLLSISPVQQELTQVFFPNSQTTSTPYTLFNGINLFKIYNEFPQGAPNSTEIITLINAPIVNTTSTVAQSFVLDSNGNYFNYHIGTNVGSRDATIISTSLAGDITLPNGYKVSRVGNIAVTPNVITSVCIGYTDTGPDEIQIDLESAAGIFSGATFSTTATSSPIVVNSATTTTVYVPLSSLSQGLSDVRGQSLIFKNAPFSEETNIDGNFAFPTMVTMVNNSANTFTGNLSTFKGSIYASKTHLEITYNNPDNVNTNTFILDVMPPTSVATSATIGDTSTNLASAFFVHSVMPFGSIIMWYGNSNNVPTGWAICDGGTYQFNGQSYTTPDLSDKFIVAASNVWSSDNFTPTSTIVGTSMYGNSTSTGGTSSASVGPHLHDNYLTTGTHVHAITDPGHYHNYYGPDGVLNIVYQSPNNGLGIGWNWGQLDRSTPITDSYRATVPSGAVGAGTNFIQNASINITETEPTVAATNLINTSTGIGISQDASVANIPPFVAVFYIMKISGAGIFNSAAAIA